jgi:hypothetical protein
VSESGEAPVQNKPWWKRWWVWVIGGFLLIGAIGSSSDGELVNPPAESSTEQSKPASDATAEATEEPQASVRLSHVAGTVHKAKVRIAGWVDPTDARVRIGGRTASVGQSGRFAKLVPLSIGSNDIDIEAEAPGHQDFAGSISVKRKRSAAELEAIRIAREKRRIAREQRRRARIARLTQSFSGNGSQSIGTVRVEVESLLEWTNSEDPEFRQMLIYDKAFGMSVSSEAASGKTVVEPGSYRAVTVAGGDWTISIHPR